MTGQRMPTWRERENNKRRERRRRAIAAKIYTGLRIYGNYKLPKHCDNNEVLKALCQEAGWVVEEDGTTYRKGCKPVAVAIDHMDIVGGSASVSPYSSHQPSPRASYNPSPSSSSFPSPAHYMASLASNFNPNNTDPNSLIPWLKNLSSNGTTTTNSSSQSPKLPYLYMGGSISAPVTPPLSSPMCTTPRARNAHHWEDSNAALPWLGPAEQYSLPSSTPPSPGRQVLPEPAWLANVQGSHTSPTSPTFSLVSSNPFGLREGGGGSRMWTPGQSGACSPAIPAGTDGTGDVPMAGVAPSEFAFGSCSMTGMVKAWEGERIHEESVNEPDDLELTLGSSRTR